jgi:hypothetical protein
MVWRLHEHVLRGKIDNRMRGRVTGEIWLAGIEQPRTLRERSARSRQIGLRTIGGSFSRSGKTCWN